MGAAKQMIYLLEVIAWGLYVGGAVLFSPVSISMSSNGFFPTPSVMGLGGIPVTNIGIATGVLIVGMAVTGWLIS